MTTQSSAGTVVVEMTGVLYTVAYELFKGRHDEEVLDVCGATVDGLALSDEELDRQGNDLACAVEAKLGLE